MSWTGERGETLYETCREKGLAITKKKFNRRIRCLNCLTIKSLLENIPDDEPILAYFPAIVTSMKTTTQLKDNFYAAKTGECSKCLALSGSTGEAASQLARLENDLYLFWRRYDSCSLIHSAGTGMAGALCRFVVVR